MGIATSQVSSGILRAVMDDQPLGIALLRPLPDGDFAYVYTNRAHEGLKPAVRSLGRTYGEVWPELASLALPRFREVIETGEPWAEHDAALEVEIEPGVPQARYYTFEASRLERDGETLLLDISRETTAEVTERTRLLLEATDALGSSLDLQQVLERLSDLVMRVSGRSRLVAYLFEETGEKLTIAVARGVDVPRVGQVMPLTGLSAATRRAVRGRQVVIDDVDAPVPGERGLAGPAGAHIMLIAPLVFRDRVMGLLSVDEPARRVPFSDREVQVISAIAQQGAVAIENARLYESARSELVSATVLKEAATAAQTLDPVELADRVLEALRATLGLRAAIVYRLDEEASVLRRLAFVGYPREVEPLFEAVPLDDRSVSGRTVLRDDLLTFQFEELPEATRRRAEATGETSSTWVAAPVHARGKVIGSLTLVFEARRDFGEQDLSLFRSVGDQLGGAMDNARLFEAERSSRRLTSVLADVSSTLSATLDLDTAMPDALRIAGEALDSCGATVASREEGGWRMRYAYGIDLEKIGEFHTDEESPVRMEVLRTRRPHFVGDVETGWRDSLSLARRAGFRALLSLPLLFRDNVIGALSFYFAEPRRPFSEMERGFLRRLLFIIASSQENVRLYEREREEARLGAVLVEIDSATHSSLRMGEAVRAALSLGAQAIGADSAAVEGVEDGIWTAWYDHGFRPSIVGVRHTPEQNPHGEASLRTGKTIAIDDAFTDPRVDNETMKAYGLRSVVVAPLVVRGEAIAALYYNYSTGIHHFTASETGFVSRIASSLSLAIENARLFEAQQRVADTLQEALLTLPDAVEGLEFADSYHSATEAARVGGDFYDIFELEHGLVGITVGDIAGKGIDAAVLTSLVKNALRAQATEHGRTPGEVMRTVNTVLFRASSEESFATVFFAVLDRTTGELRYVNAGHTTAAVVAGSGEALRELRATGTIVGAFPDAAFDIGETTLGAGDVLFLYTDGLTEARREGELFGEARLFGLLTNLRGESPETMMSTVRDTVVRYAGGSLSDDLAILALRTSVAAGS